jgi:hypothetical protein
MACAGLNIIIVSILTLKFLADNAKARVGRKVIEDDVRHSNSGSDQLLTSPARFPVHYLIDHKLLYYLGHAPNADTRHKHRHPSTPYIPLKTR